MYLNANVMIPVYKINDCTTGLTIDIKALKQTVESIIAKEKIDCLAIDN